MQQSSKEPWWRTDEYDSKEPVPVEFTQHEGPKGLALVRVWPDGRTDQGWGLQGANGGEGFMPRYKRGEFNDRRILYGFNRDKWAFAFIMRSVQMICFDIDGKNGGFDHAKRLGPLPRTLAETSKSGNGYHLFYLTDEKWDDDTGFGLYGDRIGIETGVDVRGAGCVYHHDTQRWNDREPVELPHHLSELLKHKAQKTAATGVRIQKVLQADDPMEVLMMHDQILMDLAKPIPQGKRNTTLFALGSQMMEARITDWEDHLERRAAQVGLDQSESDKIIANVKKYAKAPTP